MIRRLSLAFGLAIGSVAGPSRHADHATGTLDVLDGSGAMRGGGGKSMSQVVWRGAKLVGQALLAMLALVLAPVMQAQAMASWQGRWDTDFGELRLVQTGDRVHGDYATTGMIEARLSPDGRTLRGAFNRHDGDWGMFSFEISADGKGWTGRWAWRDDVSLDTGVWSGRRTSPAVPRLTEAVDAPVYWPIEMYEAPTAAFLNFISFTDMAGGGSIDRELVGSWLIEGPDGKLGTLDVLRSDQGLGEAFGHLRVWLGMGGTIAHAGDVGTRAFNRDRLIVFIRSEAFDGEYRLDIKLADVASGGMDAVLHGPGFRETVRLKRSVDGPSSPGGEDEPFEDDLPGVGVSGPAYRLIGVPAGKRLSARTTGKRDAASVGSLPANASEILVFGCEPYMEAFQYEELSDEGKRRVLDASWCEIRHENVVGFIPGRHLKAIDR